MNGHGNCPVLGPRLERWRDVAAADMTTSVSIDETRAGAGSLDRLDGASPALSSGVHEMDSAQTARVEWAPAHALEIVISA
jgi:hypothetical protein